MRPRTAELGFQSILAERGLEQTQRSVGSGVYLLDHIEMCFTMFRAHYIALTCVRSDHEGIAGTAVASIENILAAIDPGAIPVLFERRFKTTVDESFLAGWGELDKKIWVDDIAVLSGAPERPRIRVDFAETVGKDSDAEAALEALRTAVGTVREVIQLRPGDLVIAENVFAMYGRTPFKPRYDGMDRWLLRTFVTRDLTSSLEVRPGEGRVVDPDYRVWLNDN